MQALGFFARESFILIVAWLASIRYAVGRVRTLFIRDPRERASAVAHLRGRVLRGVMETLGATFIKLGQVMSTRPDLFAPGVIEELKLLQDKLPAFPGARAIIERELGKPIDEVFSELEETPVAAASVAQVHRARLRPKEGEKEGLEVAIKVLRPDVRQKAERDGRILVLFATILERISGKARHAELRAHTAELMRGILEQTDLRTEAANYARFRENFKRERKVRFPRVIAELSGERVMTMEFMRGEKVTPALKARFPDLPARLREVFLKMCFDDGFLHADLHPGNFVVGAKGEIIIFDVGLAKGLSDELLEYYIDFNKCLVMGEVDDFMHHMRTYHRYVDGTVDWAELEKDVRMFADEFRSKSTKELEFGDLIDRVFATGRKHGVRPQPEMTLMMVGLVTAEGIGKQLDPEANSFQEVANYLIPVLIRRNMMTPTVMAAAEAMAARQARERGESPIEATAS